MKIRDRATQLTTRGSNGKEIIPYGPSGDGYILRLAPEELRSPRTVGPVPIDPLYWRHAQWTEHKRVPVEDGKVFTLRGGGTVFGRSIEGIDPDGRISFEPLVSYTRVGTIVHPWHASGIVFFAIHNINPNPVRIYPGQGICKVTDRV